MVSFEIFVKAMPPSLSELKVLASFCFAFKIPDDVTASSKYMPWELLILFVRSWFQKSLKNVMYLFPTHWFCMFSFCTNLRMIAKHCWIKLWTCFNPQFLIQHEHTVAQLNPDPEAWGQSRVKRRRQKREDEARERVKGRRLVWKSGGPSRVGHFLPP